MIYADDIYLGFDPGGAGRFGASLIAGPIVHAISVSSVNEAMDWATRMCGKDVPLSAGIDSLLHWSDAPGGWRPVDKALRASYPKSASSVISPNGLYGSMVIGGMALAFRLRERWPTIFLCETHPKLLIPALGGQPYTDANPEVARAWFADYSGIVLEGSETGHDLDAIISAWVVKKGIEDLWVDLVGDSDALIRPVGPVRYLWPRTLGGEDGTAPTKGKLPKPHSQRTRSKARTTAIGYVNKHQQRVVERTDLPGSDHRQFIYVLRCETCGHNYGANGSDVWLRRCPKHDGGAPGFSFANQN